MSLYQTKRAKMIVYNKMRIRQFDGGIMMDKQDKQTERLSSERTAVWYRRLQYMANVWQEKRWRFGALLLPVAFLLGRVSVIGESTPLGLGFFAAVFAYSAAWGWGVLFCVLAGSLSAHEVGDVLLIVSAALFIWQGSVRWGVRYKDVRIPILCGISSLGVGGLYRFLAGGSLYDGLVVILSSVLAMLFTGLVLYGLRIFYQEDQRWKNGQVQEGFLAIVSVLALAVSGIGDLTILDCGVQMAAGTLLALVLLTVMELGIALAGCIALGFVIGIGDGNVSMTMAEYAMASLMGGAFRSLGKGGSILGFLVGLSGMLICFDPYGALWYMMAEATVGATVFALIPVRYLRRLKQYLTEVALYGGSEMRIRVVRDKLGAIESLFAYMAKMGASKEDTMEGEDRQGQTATILAAVEEAACTVCEKRKNCWEEDFFAVTQEILSLDSDQSLKTQEAFRRRCPSSAMITQALQKVTREQSQTRYWKTRYRVQQSLLCEQMRSIGEIMRQAKNELVPKKELQQDRRQRIVNRLCAWGCRVEELTIDDGGCVRMEVICPSCGGVRICEERILSYLERSLSMRLRMSVICGAQNRLRRCRLFFVTQERIRLFTGMVAFGKAQGELSGDTCETIKIGQGKVAVLLSDGMGSGQEASSDSQETVYLLKQLLTAGFDAQVSVQTVNTLLSMRFERERFATVDVLVVDQYTAEAEFIKVGAPSAFIKRQSEVIVVQNESLPLGIVKGLVAPPIRMQLEDGDFVVMMSDGVLDIPQDRIPGGHTKESWVRSQIRLFSHKSPQDLAEHIAQMAIRLSGREIHDDITVVALKIKAVSRI